MAAIPFRMAPGVNDRPSPPPAIVDSPAIEEHLEAVAVGTRFLHTSPEFAMKRILAAGLCRIYQITPCFREEEAGVHHSREFSMLEWYVPGFGRDALLTQTCDLLAAVGVVDDPGAVEVLSVAEALRRHAGVELDVGRVHRREAGMGPYEGMLSESQERMLVVIEKGFEKELVVIFDKWDLHCTQIGEVTNSKMLEVYHGNDKVAEIPSKELVLGGGAPEYDMPIKEPEYFSKINNFSITSILEPNDYNKTLLTLLSSPNITSKRFIYNQYDSTVRSNTTQGPGGDGAVIRLKGTPKGLAMSTDCNGRYVYLNPRMGGKIAVAEAARNVICSGGDPIAITNCLNFGNPEKNKISF